MKLGNLSLKTLLLGSMLTVGTLPLLGYSFLFTGYVDDMLESASFSKLESIRKNRQSQIEDYFKSIENQLVTLAGSTMIVEAMSGFREAFHALDASDADSYKSKITEYYQSQFGAEFTRQTGEQADIHALLPTYGPTLVSQYRYIASNSHPLGSKHELDADSSGDRYSQLHAKFHPLIRDFLNRFGYYDIFLVDPETGHIVYSVFKELDYGTSLTDGPYSNTNFARSFKAALEGKPASVHLEDFEPYLPSYNNAASFIAAPVYDADTLIGVLIFQMPVDRINGIMFESAGLGETGETYMIGKDGLMRSQSRLTRDPTLGLQSVDTESTRAAFSGDIGTIHTTSWRGTPVLSAFSPLSINGLDWVMVAEIGEAEALGVIDTLHEIAWLMLAFCIVLISVAGMLVARSVCRQLGSDPSRLAEVADAIANDNLDIEIDTNRPATGVYASIVKMRDNLRHRIETDRAQLDRTERLSQALEGVSANVMIADPDGNIIYMNKAATKLLRSKQDSIRAQLPEFDVDTLVGTNFDCFHKDPSRQRGMVESLTKTFTSDIEVGRSFLRIIANPVFNAQNERLGTVVEWADRYQEVVVENEIQDIVRSALDGDLSRRIDMRNKDGFIATLSSGINDLVDVSERVINDTVSVVGSMANGDLTSRIETEYQGSFADLKDNINSTADKLTEVVEEIRNSSSTVLSGSHEIAEGNNDLSTRTEQQSSHLEETASSMEQMTSTVKQNADNAHVAESLAGEASSEANKGGKVVTSAVSAMQEITESSKQIADIISVIDEIAFQTNLLALNAAVEAARAGEQGRGFAVVASEVRNLAGRSATAAKEIKDLIKDSVSKVEEGSRLVDESGQTLEAIMTSVKKVSDIIAEIAAASQEQSNGIAQVSKAIYDMDQMTQQNAALVEQAAASSEAMGNRARTLDELVSFFNTGSHNTRSTDDCTSRNANAPRVSDGTTGGNWDEF